MKYGPKAFRQMSEEAVLEKMQHSGFDAMRLGNFIICLF